MRDARFTAARTAAAFVTVAALVVGHAACGSGSQDASRSTQSVEKHAGAVETGCTPTVMVVRHAEDEANPDGGADILSSVGIRHADLYPKLFRDYLARTHSIGPDGTEVSACPIGR